MKAYQDASSLRTGLRPNVLVVSREVDTKLQRHPDVIELLSGGATPGNPAIANNALLARIFGVERYLVADGIKVTSPENKDFETSMTMARIAGKHALLVYAAPDASIDNPSGGYTFSWRGRFAAGPEGQRVKRFRLEAIESDRIEGQMAYVPKLVCSDCGVFFNGIIA